MALVSFVEWAGARAGGEEGKGRGGVMREDRAGSEVGGERGGGVVYGQALSRRKGTEGRGTRGRPGREGREGPAVTRDRAV